jgi:hypothetical protein
MEEEVMEEWGHGGGGSSRQSTITVCSSSLILTEGSLNPHRPEPNITGYVQILQAENLT